MTVLQTKDSDHFINQRAIKQRAKDRSGASQVDTVAWFLLTVVGLYLISAFYGFPQCGTELVTASHQAGSAGVAAIAVHVPHDQQGTGEQGGAGVDGTEHAPIAAPPVLTVIPFVLLLGAIAVLPLISATELWWEHNLNRFIVALALSLVTLAYYAFLHSTPFEAHWPAHTMVPPSGEAVEWGFVQAIIGNAMLAEFVPFIVLLFSLYTIAGGIRIEGDLQANPMTNVSFMAVGGLLASFIGTTGAAMLLIRPLLETNQERKHVKHTVVFFIFVVCNCGGCLLPIGDPPLFLGYLQGVDFLWTLNLWGPWLFLNSLLLLTYSMIDQFVFYRKETIRDIERDIEQTRRLKISGLKVNGPLLLGVVLAVGLLDPSKSFPGTHWHAWMYLREIVQLALVAISLLFGSKRIRRDNNFNYHAIVEVAALFTGIFICMQPALQILGVKGAALSTRLDPAGFFWATGALSSFLDNAPTYLVFFQTAKAGVTEGATLVAGVPEMVLKAISLGAVFMGAMTYIGNGPNFMVKAIAEKSGVKMPSFFGYMGYSVVFMLPLLVLTVWRYL
jgi:Na+/H+ antiporter NhaD/arsenite permease-like protein